MTDDERRAEVEADREHEAVALAIQAAMPNTPGQLANVAIAALDRVRDARGEIEAVKRTRPKVGALISAWRRYADDLEAALDRVRDARGDDEDNEAYDPRPAEVARLARIEEIDIVARTWWAHESGHEPWRNVANAVKNAYKARAGEVIAALDRLREE